MTIKKRCNLVLILCFLCFHGTMTSTQAKYVNVLDFRARPDGSYDNSKEFIQAWKVVCHGPKRSTLYIPEGDWLLSAVNFTGPCKNPPSVKIEGHLMAETDLTKYPNQEWIYFSKLIGFTLTGSGTLDGQGESIWKLNDCYKNISCIIYPSNLKFSEVTNSVVEGLTSLNSKNKNFDIIDCNNVKIWNVKIQAPYDSPDTDGINVEHSDNIAVQNARIATGGSCITLGSGSSNIYASSIDCGPSHGISVSLGRYPNEKDISGVVIKESVISGSMYGIWIRTWPNSRSINSVSNVTYDDIVVSQVDHPILFDQQFCPYKQICANKAPSRVQIKDVTIRDVRGTSNAAEAVTFRCSKAYPCQNIMMDGINIVNAIYSTGVTSSCENVVNIRYNATQSPKPCKLL